MVERGNTVSQDTRGNISSVRDALRLLFARHRRCDRAEIFQQFPAHFSVCLQPCELLIQLDGIGRAPVQAAIHRTRVKVHRIQQRLDLNDFLFDDRFGGGRWGRRRLFLRIVSTRLLKVRLAGCKPEFG